MATEQEIRDLAEALKPLAHHAVQGKGKMGEENTKFKIVVPILHALGWRSERMDLEYSVGGQSVDVALCDENEQPLVFVEVKGLNVTLKPDAKEVDQALRYAFKAGTVRWAVLTNGLLWWAYDCHAKLPTDRRRFLAADLGSLEDSQEAVARQLIMLSSSAVTDRRLDSFAGERLWRQEIARLCAQGDPDLLALLRRKIGLEEEGLRAALRSAWTRRRSPGVATGPGVLPPDVNAPRPSGAAPVLVIGPDAPAGVGTDMVAQPASPVAPPERHLPTRSGAWSVRIGETESAVSHARDVLVLAVQHLMRLGVLGPERCPVRVTRGTRVLIHTAPIHDDGRPFRAPVEVGEGIYVETHYGSRYMNWLAKRLFELFGLGADTIELLCGGEPV